MGRARGTIGEIAHSLTSCRNAVGGPPFTLHFYRQSGGRYQIQLAFPGLPPREWRGMSAADFRALEAASVEDRDEQLAPHLTEACRLTNQFQALLAAVEEGHPLALAYLGDHDTAERAALEALVRTDTPFTTTWYVMDEPDIRHRVTSDTRALTLHGRTGPLEPAAEVRAVLGKVPRARRSPALRQALDAEAQAYLRDTPAAASAIDVTTTMAFYDLAELAIMGDLQAQALKERRHAHHAALEARLGEVLKTAAGR